MSETRGSVWRIWDPSADITEDSRPWGAMLFRRHHAGCWGSNIGRYESQADALAAVCRRLKDGAA